MEMPFGKYKGTPIEQVPREYLEWLWNAHKDPKYRTLKLKGALRRTIGAHLGLDVETKPQVSRCVSLRYVEPPYGAELPPWPDGWDVSSSDECPFDVEECELDAEFRGIVAGSAA